MDWQDRLKKAREHLSRAEHMFYVGFALLKEYRMIIQIFEELHKATNFFIIGLLQKERAEMRIQLYKDKRLNFKVFREKVALRYMNPEDLKVIIEILRIWKQHLNSNMEFVRKDRFVILFEDRYEILGAEEVGRFLDVLKRVLK